MELSDLYSDKIIEIAGQLPITTPLAAPDAKSRRVSRVCGSVVEVELNLKNGKVSDYAHEISACALGQTSSSIMAAHILGSTPDDLRNVRMQMYAMLKEDGTPPEGAWEDLRYLEPVRTYRARHTSTLLIFDAVVDCLDEIEKVSAG